MLCATLFVGGLEAPQVTHCVLLCLLEVLEVMRCVLLRLPEVMCRVLLYSLEVL